MVEFQVMTTQREELVDIGDQVRDALRRTGVEEGICLVDTPHTTCGVAINEGYDPAVAADVLQHLRALVPRQAGFAHAEGNSDAHLKAILVGGDVTLPVTTGTLRLGRWQTVFLCEFDGPRRRTVRVVAR